MIKCLKIDPEYLLSLPSYEIVARNSMLNNFWRLYRFLHAYYFYSKTHSPKKFFNIESESKLSYVCSDCVNRLNDLALFARGHDDVNCGEHSFPICVLPVRSLCK